MEELKQVDHYGGMVLDYVQVAVNSVGLSYDMDTSLSFKITKMIEVHRKSVADESTSFAFFGVALLTLICLGVRLKGSTVFSTKLVCLFLSAMVRNATMTGGDVGNFRMPVEGAVMLAFSLASPVLFKFFPNVVTKLSFPLDMFTAGLFFSAACDSGYSKLAMLIPIMGMTLRSTFACTEMKSMEELPVVFISLISFYLRQSWGRRRNAYDWPDQRGRHPPSHQHQKVKPRAPKVAPMIREVHDGKGGVQGLSFVKELQLVDEDGDEAMEFFEVTDEGLRKRVPHNNT
ncbi:hypothetical protein GUITHDRAFT_99514 [Guillardia theta CCMP2712]|uniref:Uncharacterized protein n=1 Tax=Guillardia theta (strain CCMP2712) TaxID=905079 RepID=L1K3C8_GUITC|nr:hypothetical protein GUITHDRAFT_99514 [Guillardia theta CCMP2712]EKX54863.1 hypothetical protein GUITHDRAFT_99514 [Guillardia theta CCMP2712]|eukprot:XP_005841843.1 hypothetical protein GUITHDRAFT_99514 [Guillardia theta CCMP2712]